MTKRISLFSQVPASPAGLRLRCRSFPVWLNELQKLRPPLEKKTNRWTKLDGYRAIAVIDASGKARLWSRNHLPLEPKFPTIQDAVRQLKLCSTILDGEIVALDKEGVPRFQLLQQWQKRPTAPVVFYLFDLLWSAGHDVTG
ncbi:MAG TPA: hypothetical protein VN957_17280 [Chthoniobacterales bacterium]|nr:hypothetical protein [Chthoniobacterales bacterium]